MRHDDERFASVDNRYAESLNCRADHRRKRQTRYTGLDIWKILRPFAFQFVRGRENGDMHAIVLLRRATRHGAMVRSNL